MRIRKGQILIDPIYDSDYHNPLSKLIKIPDSAKERCDQGVVRELGEDCDPSITIGSHIIFSGYSGTNIGIDGRVFILLHNKFVKAILTTNEERSINGLWMKGKIPASWYENWKSIFPALSGDLFYQMLKQYDEQKYFPAPRDTVVSLLVDDASKLHVDVKKEEYKEQRDPFDEDNV